MFYKVHSVSGVKGDLFGMQSRIRLEEGPTETLMVREHLKKGGEEAIIGSQKCSCNSFMSLLPSPMGMSLRTVFSKHAHTIRISGHVCREQIPRFSLGDPDSVVQGSTQKAVCVTLSQMSLRISHD